MKISMKEFTPHYVVEAYQASPEKVFNKHSKASRNYFDDESGLHYRLWHGVNQHTYKQGSKEDHLKSFAIVQQIDPFKFFLKYKAYRAYRTAKIHSAYINFPYQFLLWKFCARKNLNNNQWSMSMVSPEILFSPGPWVDNSTINYYPWLPNVLGAHIGSYFCNSSASKNFLSEDFFTKNLESPTIETFLTPEFLNKMVRYYDMFLEEPFNGDAGGFKLKNTIGSSAIVGPFKNIQKLTAAEVLDPNSNWYKYAREAKTKAEIKLQYERTSFGYDNLCV